jgi:thiamine biosynthesis lipoprotein
MGTILEITLCPQRVATPQHTQQTLDGLFTATAHVESLLSTFSQDSPVSFLNAHAGYGAYAVPPMVVDLLTLSHRYWRLTHGTFDITVGPFMKVWSLAGESQQTPSPAVLQHAQAKVGNDKIKIFPDARVMLTQVGMAIDLGGIGKGYALDQLVRTLKTQHIKGALLDFGQSSLWALGSPPDAPRWRLLVQRPTGQQVGVISLHNQALSVSASFGQAFTIQGQQYGHVIDPRSGLPLQRDLLACVVAPDATQAEALSKALLILGEKEGITLLEQLPQTEGFLSEFDGQQWMTTGWQAATAFTQSR